jgi:outer membrane protein TolC
MSCADRSRGRAGVALLLALAACHAVNEPVVAPSWPPAAADAPLTRADCVRLACAWAPARDGWRARYLTAVAQVRAAGLLPNPQLLLEWEDFSIGPAVPASLLQQTFTLSWAIGDVLLRSTRESIATHELEATLAELQTERRNLAVEVCRAYDGLVAARRAAAIATSAAAAAARHRDALQRLAGDGEAPPFDAAVADAEAAEAAAAAAAAQREAGAQELAFAFALGFERPVPLQLADGLNEPVVAADLESLLAQAAAARPELAAARAHYAAQLDRLHVAASPLRYIPVVGAGYRRIDGESLGVATLDVALPLFDAGGADVAAADAVLLDAAARARVAAHVVAGDVASTAARVAAARSRRDEARDVAARRTALCAAALRWFEAGELGFADLRSAETAALTAQRELLDAGLALSLAGWPLCIDDVLPPLPPPDAANGP